MKQQMFAMALLTVLALPLSARAESGLPNQSSEWAGVKQIMRIMGKGTLSPADQSAMLEILNTKDAVEAVKPVTPGSFPVTPVQPGTARKLPPHRSPSTF